MRTFILQFAALCACIATTGVASAATIGSGVLTGIFEDPAGDPGMIVSGVGTNNILSGVPFAAGDSETRLNFQSSGFANQAQGETFVGGVLSYTNGSIAVGTAMTEASLRLTATSTEPDFNRAFIERIFLGVTDNLTTNTPEQNADIFYFSNRPDLGGFRVLEGQSAQVEVLLQFNSSLDLIGFGNVLTPTTGFLTASAFTPVDPDFSVAPVPVPAALPMLAVAFGLLGYAGRRRRAT